MRFALRLNYHASSNGLIGTFVNQNDTTCNAVLAIAVNKQRLGRVYLDAGYVIHLKLFNVFNACKRIDVELVLNHLQYTSYFAGGVADIELAVQVYRALVHPAQHQVDILNTRRVIIGFGNYIAAADVNFILKRDG